jgi:hypothetical protein
MNLKGLGRRTHQMNPKRKEKDVAIADLADLADLVGQWELTVDIPVAENVSATSPLT